jgi:hypothetical protein
MKDKIFIGIIGSISIIATGIPIYNYYILPVIRDKEMLDKIGEFDKRLKKLEKIIIYKMGVLNEKRCKIGRY